MESWGTMNRSAPQTPFVGSRLSVRVDNVPGVVAEVDRRTLGDRFAAKASAIGWQSAAAVLQMERAVAA